MKNSDQAKGKEETRKRRWPSFACTDDIVFLVKDQETVKQQIDKVKYEAEKTKLDISFDGGSQWTDHKRWMEQKTGKFEVSTD